MPAGSKKRDVRNLWIAYGRTTFVAHTDVGVIRIRLGRRSQRLDRMLSLHSAVSWAFITAYNPGSALRPDKTNEVQQAKLLRAVRRLGLKYWPGEGIGGDRKWPAEPSLLILELD